MLEAAIIATTAFATAPGDLGLGAAALGLDLGSTLGVLSGAWLYLQFSPCMQPDDILKKMQGVLAFSASDMPFAFALAFVLGLGLGAGFAGTGAFGGGPVDAGAGVLAFGELRDASLVPAGTPFVFACGAAICKDFITECEFASSRS